MDDVQKLFSVTKPCKDCPFRKENDGMLQPGRLEGTIRALHDNKPFHCHKTIDYSKSRKMKQVEHARYCGGSMIYLEKARNTNLPMRMGLLWGYYDPDKLSGHEDVIEPLGLDRYVRSPEELQRIREKYAKSLFK
jgi:hypothetical protein